MRRRVFELVPTPAPMEKKRAARVAEHRSRAAAPIALLAIDPGATSGYAIFDAQGELARIGVVEVATRDLEKTVTLALDIGGGSAVLATESWNRGGPMGIEQWLSLGAARGAWEREFRIRCPKGAIVRASVASWRSTMIDATRSASGKRFASKEWKREARAVAVRTYGVPEALATDDSAEAFLLGYYAHRSDEAHAAAEKAKRRGLI